MEKLSSTLKQLLNTANISEAELARRTGIAQPMVNRLATGKNKNPKLETLKPIAKYFSVTFSQLLGEEDLPIINTTNKLANLTANSTFQLPVVSWNDVSLENLTSEKMIATTANVSANAFALIVENNSLEPRFPANTLLTFDPNLDAGNNDFVMVKTNAQGEVNLMQVKKENETTQLTNLSGDKATVAFSHETHTILGVLVQAKHDFK